MKISEHKLKNGIKIILAKTSDTDMVSCNVFIGTGSRNETPKTYGMSHFLEHLLFKGTPSFPTPSEFTGAIESIGGAQNAWTSEDHTMYWNMVPKKYLNLSLMSLSEQVSEPLLDEKEIDKERGTVIEEIKRMQDDPYQLISHHLNKTLWPNQPLECDILGNEENIRHLSRKDFLRYLNSQYVANNMVISIAGNFNEATALKLINKYFRNIKRGTSFSAKKAVIRQKDSKINLVNKNLEQGHAILAYHTFGFGNKKRYALDVLMAVLAGGMSSLLFIEIREKRGLAYAIEGGTHYFDDCGFTYIYGGFNKNKLEEAIKVITEIKTKSKNELFEDASIKKAKEYLKGSILMRLDGVRSVSTVLGQKKLLSPLDIDYHKTIQAIDQVTAKEIQKVAREIFVPQNENLIILGPYKNKEKFAKILAHNS